MSWTSMKSKASKKSAMWDEDAFLFHSGDPRSWPAHNCLHTSQQWHARGKPAPALRETALAQAQALVSHLPFGTSLICPEARSSAPSLPSSFSWLEEGPHGQGGAFQVGSLVLESRKLVRSMWPCHCLPWGRERGLFCLLCSHELWEPWGLPSATNLSPGAVTRGCAPSWVLVACRSLFWWRLFPAEGARLQALLPSVPRARRVGTT